MDEIQQTLRDIVVAIRESFEDLTDDVLLNNSKL